MIDPAGVGGGLPLMAPPRGPAGVEFATLEWVHWYNHRRLFGPLGHVPPAAFEAHYSHQLHESAMVA